MRGCSDTNKLCAMRKLKALKLGDNCNLKIFDSFDRMTESHLCHIHPHPSVLIHPSLLTTLIADLNIHFRQATTRLSRITAQIYPGLSQYQWI